MKFVLLLLIFFSVSASASNLSIPMNNLNTGKFVGVITVTQTKYGMVFTPHLKGLPTGLHGFHIHVNPSCKSIKKMNHIILGGAAGGHYDPFKTNKHGSPWGDHNHLGDLPAIYVNINGKAEQPVLAPRLRLSDLKGRALMIHIGGDNYSDHPKALGGGGARLICGIIN